MRVTRAFSLLLCLPGVWVRSVLFGNGIVVVTVVLRRRRLICPRCGYSTPFRANLQRHDSVWRHLDLGLWRLEVHARLRRLRCPVHGVLVEGVPFARPGARFTADFEDLVVWLACKMDKSTLCRLVRIDWATVGRIIERAGAQHPDRDRLDGLFRISVDDVAWRKGQRYLTLIGDHDRSCVVWGCDGRGRQAMDQFFKELDPQAPPALPPSQAFTTAATVTDARPAGADKACPAIMVPFGPSASVEAGRGISARWLDADWELDPALVPRASRLVAVSMDMTGGYAASVREHAPQAKIVIDNYHVVALAGQALDEVRREHWRALRSGGEPDAALQFKHDRWALLKNPTDLTDRQAVVLAQIQAGGGKLARAWAMKEMVRAIFAKGLTVEQVSQLIDRLLARLSRCRIPAFIRLGRTIRKHRDGILAAREFHLSNARAEALNNKVKLLVRRAYGFHSSQAALALIHLACGPTQPTLPHEHAFA